MNKETVNRNYIATSACMKLKNTPNEIKIDDAKKIAKEFIDIFFRVTIIDKGKVAFRKFGDFTMHTLENKGKVRNIRMAVGTSRELVGEFAYKDIHKMKLNIKAECKRAMKTADTTFFEDYCENLLTIPLPKQKLPKKFTLFCFVHELHPMFPQYTQETLYRFLNAINFQIMVELNQTKRIILAKDFRITSFKRKEAKVIFVSSSTAIKNYLNEQKT